MSFKANYSSWPRFEVNHPFTVKHNSNPPAENKGLIINSITINKIKNSEYTFIVSARIEVYFNNIISKMEGSAHVLVLGNINERSMFSENDILELKRILFKVNYIAVKEFNQAWIASNLPKHTINTLTEVDTLNAQVQNTKITFNG